MAWLTKTAMCVPMSVCGCTRYSGCTLQVVCAVEGERRYHKDNLAVSQIFIGTVPLMGAANEILPRFRQGRDTAEGAGDHLHTHSLGRTHQSAEIPKMSPVALIKPNIRPGKCATINLE